MKLLVKRRNLFILFGVFIAGAIFYMLHSLNTIEEFKQDGVKDEVKFLKEQIEILEKKAVENENNLKNLEKIYKKFGDANKETLGKINNQSLVNKAEIPEAKISQLSELKLNAFNSRQNFDSALDLYKLRSLENINSGLRFQKLISLERDLKSYPKQCEWLSEHKEKNSDFEIAEMLEKLPFDDVDGGVWKQGFDIKYDQNQWSGEKKLHVFVIPHSHNDPGWLMTFEEYFNQRTKHILDAIVNSLSEKESRKFIWAETSYLSLWWAQASAEMKSKLRRLIVTTKQLEIVTGGWVMNDEANSHYYAMLEQMIEGREWLRANIDASIRPTYGWSIDPFGYTPTMAYILKQMGFDAMLVQRVHYHVKKYMAQTLRFEFEWRQSWSTISSKETSIFCHVMPFYSYDIPHTCGPDPKICCQFDFKRMDGAISCPWGINPQPINAHNVHERASTLLDQYRKKSQLYGDRDNHNVLLVPLGDDFRYRDLKEARDQFENYEKLMEYMNAKKEWNVEVKFGTLKDYFELLSKKNLAMKKKVEVFTGDFFTYADRQDHYWSGYYTSRPFNKRLDRLVEYYVRSAEVIFSFANILQQKIDSKFTNLNSLYKKLLESRRNLALFQHHDGITGTSKTPVVLDYEQKLFTAMNNGREIMEESAAYLMSDESSVFSIEDVSLGKTNSRNFNKPVIDLSGVSEKKIVLYNSDVNERDEVVKIRVSEPSVEVFDSSGKVLSNVQVALVWPNLEGVYLSEEGTQRVSGDNLNFGAEFDADSFELLFHASLPGLSLTTFTIRKKAVPSDWTIGNTVTFYSNKLNKDTIEQAKKVTVEKLSKVSKSLADKIDLKLASEIESEDSFIEVKTGTDFSALFSSKTGFLKKFSSSTKQVKSGVKFIKYGTTSRREKSGAYLFLPDGPATDLNTKDLIQWIRVENNGKLRNRVCVNATLLLHCVEFYPSLDEIKNFKYPLLNVWNVVDLRQSHNFELAMHLETDIKNEDILHSDLNGFQFIKRKRHAKLTLQGNVYPMPSAAFIQDSNTRLNLLSAQPLGVASLEPSSIQVFLDRRLDQDDNRGMEQAMNDNVLTSSKFVIFLESINGASSNDATLAANFPSLISQWLSFELLNPVAKLVLNSNRTKIAASVNLLSEKKKFPCDLRLVNMRSMQTSSEEVKLGEVGLIFHRLVYEDCPSAPFVQLPSYVFGKCGSENNFSFEDYFDFMQRRLEAKGGRERFVNGLNVTTTYLDFGDKNIDLSEYDVQMNVKTSEPILNCVQPMQIEAFKVKFN